MLKTFTILFAAFALAACAGKSSSDATAASSSGGGALAMSTAFAPDPPAQGLESITVSLKDSDGNPVRGATVKIATNMPTMSMTGPSLTAKDNGDGTYTASAKLNYGTKWSFAVAADANGRHATATIEKDVP